MVRGIAGFGADHHMHTMRIERLTENLPIKIEFIESPEKVDELLSKLHEMVGTGLIEVQETMVVKPSEVEERLLRRCRPYHSSVKEKPN